MFQEKSNSSELAFESHQIEPYHVTLIFPLIAGLFWFLTQRIWFLFFWFYLIFAILKTSKSKTVFRLQKLAFNNSACLVNSDNVPGKLKRFFTVTETVTADSEEKVAFKESSK